MVALRKPKSLYNFVELANECKSRPFLGPFLDRLSDSQSILYSVHNSYLLQDPTTLLDQYGKETMVWELGIKIE